MLRTWVSCHIRGAHTAQQLSGGSLSASSSLRCRSCFFYLRKLMSSLGTPAAVSGESCQAIVILHVGGVIYGNG